MIETAYPGLARAAEEKANAKPKAPTFNDLNEKQRAFASLVDSGENVMATGPAGTGKSYLLHYLVTRYPKLHVTASTGIAALGVNGCTIHSWAGLGLGQDDAEVIAQKLIDRKNRAWYVMKSSSMLAIDEISMIDAELLEKLSDVLKIIRKNNRPFGGLQMIFFGDFLQLPPVGESGRAVRFAFESKVWQDARVNVFVLTEVMRQKDREFAGILSRVRVGDSTEEVRKLLRPRINAVDTTPEFAPVEAATHNAIADGINAKNLAALPGKEFEFKAKDWAENDMNLQQLDRNCIAPKTLTLKEGAQVMLLWNIAVDEGLCNGSLGKVVKIEESKFQTIVTVKFTNGITREIEEWEWKTVKYGDVISSRKQLPLRLGWAITIHKSQGLTLEKVRVHLKKCFSPGQAYVAMSRAKTLEGLFIADISGDSIKADSTALEFYRRFAA